MAALEKTRLPHTRARALGALGLVGLFGLTGALALPGCKKPAAAAPKTEAAPAVHRVETARAVTRRFEPFANLTGEVQPTASVKLVTQVAGIVTQLPVEEGDQVKAGALLMAIDDAIPRANLRRAEASVGVARAMHRQATADLAAAKKEQARNERLFAAKVVDEKTLDTAKIRVVQLQAQIESHAAQILQAQADVGSARASLSHYRITAPINGVVARKMARVHENVLKDKQVFDLIDTTSMEVVVNVPADAVKDLKKGGRLGFAVASLGGRTFDGEIVAVIPQLDPKSRTLRVRARLPNSDGALIDGMFAVARIPAGAPREAVAVPAVAVRGAEGEQHVWKLLGDTVDRVAVTSGTRDGDLVEVRGNLKPGDTVVVAGADVLKSGAKVLVTGTAAAPAAAPAPAAPAAPAPATPGAQPTAQGN